MALVKRSHKTHSK